MLEVKDLSVKLKGEALPIIQNINLTLKKGTITTIVGLSGCGKTTMVSAINGVIDYQESGIVSGTIAYGQNDLIPLNITERSQWIGTVFQNPDTQIVFSTVSSELAFALENHCIPRSEIKSKIEDIALKLEIKHLLERNPNTLSGGEKQLVVLAAILVLEPPVLLLDEMMSQVDEDGIRKIKRIILDLKAQDKIILMIEHELEHLDIADEVYQMKDGLLKPYQGEWDR